MKILVIMGSPRKGECYHLVQQVEEKMKSMGEVTFEYLWLKQMNLGSCLGCHACIFKGEERCPLKDDRAFIEQKILTADGVVLVSPVYAQQVTALMKNLLDHFSYLWHRPRFFGKFFMAVSSGGGQFKNTLGYLEQNVTAWGGTFVCSLGVPHMDSLTPYFHQRAEKDIDQAAQKFFRVVAKNQVPVPTLGRLLWFRMWRINASACKNSNPADFAYWNGKDWFTRPYYTDVKINFLLTALSSGIGKMIRFGMSRVYNGY